MKFSIHTDLTIPAVVLASFLANACDTASLDIRGKHLANDEKVEMKLQEGGSPSGPNTDSVSCDPESNSATGTASGSNAAGAAGLSLNETCSTCPSLSQLPDGINSKISEVERLLAEAEAIRKQILDTIQRRFLESDPIKRMHLLEEIQRLGVRYSEKLIELHGRRVALEGILRSAYPKCMSAFTSLLTRRVSQVGEPMFSTGARVLGVLGTVTCGAALNVLLDGNTCYGAEPPRWRDYSCDELATLLPEAQANKVTFCDNVFWANFGNPPSCSTCNIDPEKKRQFEQEKLACDNAAQELDQLTENYNNHQCRNLQ